MGETEKPTQQATVGGVARTNFNDHTHAFVVSVDVGDYGGSFTNWTPPAGVAGDIIHVVDTHNGPGMYEHRLYSKAGGYWAYAIMSEAMPPP